MTQENSTTSKLKQERIDHAQDAQRLYLIAPEDRDLFIRTGRQVIAACNMQLRVESWLEVYQAMLAAVKDFAEMHAEKIDSCYALPRGAKTVLSFVPQSEAFDFDLATELAGLQFELQQQFGNLVGTIEVGQVPKWDLDRFLDPSRASRVYPVDMANAD